MVSSIDDRLAKLNEKNEAKVARRLKLKQKLAKKQRNRKPNDPNYLTAKQIREARLKFGSGTHCMICMKKAKTAKAHAVDHCHVTGKIRGVLCYNCNMGLGYFKEDIEILQSALRYLEHNKFNPDLLSDEELARLLSIQNR